ncbi:MAG: hypothetical protein WDZ65_08445, partial [Aquisalimonadaceae bacterium]
MKSVRTTLPVLLILVMMGATGLAGCETQGTAGYSEDPMDEPTADVSVQPDQKSDEITGEWEETTENADNP